MVKNDPIVIAKLLRAMAGGSAAKEDRKDVIYLAAADLLDPPDVRKLREIMQDCLSAAQTYRGFDRPVDPASVVAIYERIAASIALALV